MYSRRIALLLVVCLLGAVMAAPASADSRTYTTHLTGASERPTPRDTQAQGQAIFKVAKDGQSIEYKLIVANIENVFAAHIHLGSVDEAGPVVVTLYGGPAIDGRFSGVLATGTITDADVGGPLVGTGVQGLVDAMDDGVTYVNVHTNDGIDPANTGPGDFPGGEVRGQI